MSIVTKTGDDGSTGLMYGKRVPKNHPRVEAYGTLDELNAALGMARALAESEFVRQNLLSIQKDLVAAMGELATLGEDRPRYVKDGYGVVSPEMSARLEKSVLEIEGQNIHFKGWATPGEVPLAGALDFARTVCRRAERRVWELKQAGDLVGAEIPIYLNRLSDLLWLLARWVENSSAREQENR